MVELEAAELLKAFARPPRLAIVLEVHGGERCVHDLVTVLDAAQPLVSRHRRILATPVCSPGGGVAVRWPTPSPATTSSTSRSTPSSTPTRGTNHAHAHGPDRGHASDYVHDGHRHAAHGERGAEH
ncbi:MAG: ArsR family transcriptional regulator [Ilumatobacteraceae bacterium]